jgi:PAS domain S-box-containing protein
VLIIEDDDLDAQLIVRQLERGGYRPEWRQVKNEPEFASALSAPIDVILADFHLPTFSATRALELMQQRSARIPLIVISGSIGEETAVRVLLSGAADYLLKDRLTRLGPAVERVIHERHLEIEKQRAEDTLMQAEERTRFALEAARVGVWESDLTSGVVRWSVVLEQLHGLPPQSFAGTFQAFLDRVHPDDRGEVTSVVEEAQRARSDASVLYRTVWPDGTTHWISATGKTSYDVRGVPVRAAGIGMDVTERLALEEQQRQLQKVESIGQLAGGIAHDFNNLLTAIQGYCELLAEDLGPQSDHHNDVNEIRRAADRAASLTRQLLTFSRRQLLEPRVFDLRQPVRAMEPMLRRLLEEHLRIAIRMMESPARIRADPNQIEQVVLNLAINARDAMPHGGVLSLEVTTVDVDAAYAARHIGLTTGRYAVLGVSDTGIGMDAPTQARIFEPFFTTKPIGHGTGLGLSTVYGIVKQSGGHIWVHSEPGEGSTFKVYFPWVEGAVEPSAVRPSTDSVGGSETILLVEDESGVRDLVTRVLERHGYRVLAAATPRDAVAIHDRVDEEIHLLMTDVVMPELSGRSLAKHLAGERPRLRVLYMSGFSDDAIVQRVAASESFLQKPFTPQMLLRKVRTVLTSPQ